MAKYRVTDKNGNEVKQGDTVTDFRGDTAIFEHVVRGPHEHHGSPKVTIKGHLGVYNASVFDLTVETIEP